MHLRRRWKPDEPRLHVGWTLVQRCRVLFSSHFIYMSITHTQRCCRIKAVNKKECDTSLISAGRISALCRSHGLKAPQSASGVYESTAGSHTHTHILALSLSLTSFGSITISCEIKAQNLPKCNYHWQVFQLKGVLQIRPNFCEV